MSSTKQRGFHTILFRHLAPLYCGFLSALMSLSNISGLPSHEALKGNVAEIPCNFTTASEEMIALILWYRGNSSTPIYILDARNGLTNQPKHFPSDILGDRAFFDVDVTPSVLRIKDVTEEDGGRYRCRVDYKHDPTENICLWLDIILPPREIIIMDKFGQHLHGLIGPYNEGSPLLLICEADGGRPPPALTWKKEGKVLKDNFTLTPQGFSRNEIVLPELRRQDLLSSLVCEASNSDIGSPLSSSVTLDLNLKPLDVKIITPNRPVSAGRQVELVCKTWGAKPPAEITWWKGMDRLTHVSDLLTPDSNITLSTVTFIPKAKDNLKNITCRADNSLLKDSVVSDVHSLEVYYVPQVTVSPRNLYNLSDLADGSEITVDCNIDANPPKVDVWWLFNGSTININQKLDIIIANHSLTIKNVKKNHRGRLQCVAANKEGEGWSEEMSLMVNYQPVCKSSKSKEYAVLTGSIIKVTCEVDAQPSDVQFRWSLNNSFGLLSLNTFTENGTSSVALFSPQSEVEYGTLLCWAKNKIGEQKYPCNFTVTPGAPPEAPRNCLLVNQTIETFIVRCSPGKAQGLSQHFQLEVYNKRNNNLLNNISASDAPFFVVHSLPPGTPLILLIYSANLKGRSPPETLQARTLDVHYKSTKKGKSTEGVRFSHVLGIVFGILLVVVILFLLIFVLRKLRCVYRSRQEQDIHNGQVEKDPVNSETDEESPKHDVQLLDLISTKKDFSGPPDVTHTTGKWNHTDSGDIRVDLKKDRQSSITPAETVRWRDQEIEKAQRAKMDDESSLCIISESSNSLYDLEEWRNKSFGPQIRTKIYDEENCINSETPLVNTLTEGEMNSLQSFRLGHIISTDV
ncbi:protein turtle homolog B-like [Tachypleus tridentatus]|uniref:protein turtle homolog B-like n=1 Tax=Tachypleus tridentatus TaxID=6853 RepID=UPI003FD14512